MKSIKTGVSRLAFALVVLGVAHTSAWAKDKAPAAAPEKGAAPVAVVNGVAIPESRVELVVAQQVAKGAPDSQELRAQVKGFLVGRELLAQAAKSKGLDKNPEVLAELELAKQQMMITAYLRDYARANPVSDAAVKAEYDRLVAANPQKEFKAQHILVESEQEAKDIIAKLDKGGELGWNAPTNFVKPFADALMALNKGSYTTTPVRSQFGFHIIKLEDTRDLTPPSFDEVKGQIQQALVGRVVEAHVEELRKKAKIQ